MLSTIHDTVLATMLGCMVRLTPCIRLFCLFKWLYTSYFVQRAVKPDEQTSPLASETYGGLEKLGRPSEVRTT